MAPQVVVVCSTCQPRPAAGDRWTMSIMVDKELPHLIQPVAQVVVVCSTCQPRPAAGDRWTMSIMVDKELPHLIKPVAQVRRYERPVDVSV